jgi:TPR repeat protein
VLVSQLPDPKSRARARERYLVDAQKILKKLSSNGNMHAMFFMADCLGRGLFGAEPDNKDAFLLYQSAAKQGHAAAAYRTAVCCEIGNEEGGGTRKDPLKAIQWYKRACLSPETMVRTPTGNKATRDIQVGDMLLDDEDRPVQCLTVGPIQTSLNMKTVKYQEYGSSKKVSFKCTSDHIMTLMVTSVKPFVAANSRVFWHTRCDRCEAREDAEDIKWDQVMHGLFTELSTELGRRPTDGEARRYIQAITDTRIIPDSQDEDSQMHDDPVSPVLVEFLHELEKLGVDVDDMGPGIGLSILEHMDEYLENLMPEEEAIPDDDDDLVIDIDAHAPRPRTFATLSRMPSSTHPSDPSFHPASQARASSPLTGPGGSQDAHDSQGSKTTFADTVQLVPKEDLMEKFAIVREKLNSPKSSAKCKNQACKGIRVASARFKNDEQAQLAVKLLSGDHYRVIDPYVVKEFDLFTMTLEEYQATCHYQQKPVLRKMRLYRAPLNYVPSNAPSSPVPIDPYWLGFWLGDGNKHKPLVSSSDLEIKVYCQTYVDRLNRERAPGVVGLHLAEEVVSKAGDSRLVPGGYTAICTVTTYNWTISLDSRGDRNPIIQGLRDLGLYKDKSGGIPDCYMNADEETRLAVLAGLIESDGTLSQRTNVYCFSQTTYEHKKILEDAQKLATSCGIQCTPVSESQYQDRREPTWRFWMSKGSEKFQHHLLIPRKRLDVSKVINRQNRDIRGFDVEDAGEGEYRLIEVSGGLYQLADRTVVHNCTLGDTPAMYKVGMILLKGLLGQPRNPRDAISWLKRAAERADADNPHALHELGLLYESAEGNDALVRDEAYAFQLFKQAADLGYKFSQYRMGAAYEYGLMGVPVDARLSIMWYSRAATQEEHQSELALSGWYLTGSEGVLQQSDTEAYLWARKAAMAGLAKAEYAMGYFTEVGIGVPANLEDAKRWYWRAAGECSSIDGVLR